MLDLALKLVLVEAAIFLVLSLILRRLSTAQLIYVVSPVIFVTALPHLIPSLDLNVISSTFEHYKSCWESVFRASEAVAISWSSLLTTLNSIATALTGGLYVVKLNVFYSALLVGRIYDPLSASIYTVLLLSQSMYAIFHTLHMLAEVSKILVPLCLGIALPLVALERTRPLGASILAVGLTIAFITFVAGAHVSGRASELSELYSSAIGLLSKLNSSEFESVRGGQVLVVESSLPHLVRGRLVTEGGEIELVTFTPSYPIVVPSSRSTVVDDVIFYWTRRPVGSATITSNNTHIVVRIEDPDLELIPCRDGDVSRCVSGVWRWIEGPDEYMVERRPGEARIRFSLRLDPSSRECHEVGNRTECTVIPSCKNLSLWYFASRADLRLDLPAGVASRCGERGGEHVCAHDLERLRGYQSNVISYYAPFLSTLNVSKSFTLIEPPPACPRTSRPAYIECRVCNHDNSSRLVLGQIVVVGGDEWHAWGVNDPVVPYLSHVDSYLTRYGGHARDFAVELYDKLVSATSPLGTFIPMLMVDFIVILGLLSGLGHVLGVPNVFSMIGMRVWRFIMYDLSLILCLRIFTRLPGRAIRRILRERVMSIISRIASGETRALRPIRLVARAILRASSMTSERLISEALERLERSRIKVLSAAAGALRTYHRYQLAGARGSIPIARLIDDVSKVVEPRAVRDLVLPRRAEVARDVNLLEHRPSDVRRLYLKLYLRGTPMPREVADYVRRGALSALRERVLRTWRSVVRALDEEMSSIARGRATMIPPELEDTIARALELGRRRYVMMLLLWHLFHHGIFRMARGLAWYLRGRYEHVTVDRLTEGLLRRAVVEMLDEITLPSLRRFYRAIALLRELYLLKDVPTARDLGGYARRILEVFGYREGGLALALSNMIRDHLSRSPSSTYEHRQILREHYARVVSEIMRASDVRRICELRRAVGELLGLRYSDLQGRTLVEHLRSRGYSEDVVDLIRRDRVLSRLISYKIMSSVRTNSIDLALTYRLLPPAAILQLLDKERLSRVIEDMLSRGDLSVADLRRLAPSLKAIGVSLRGEELNRIIERSSHDVRYREFVLDLFRACKIALQSTIMDRLGVRAIDLLRPDVLRRADELIESEQIRMYAHVVYDLLRRSSESDAVRIKVGSLMDKHIMPDVLRRMLERYRESLLSDLRARGLGEEDVKRLDELEGVARRLAEELRMVDKLMDVM